MYSKLPQQNIHSFIPAAKDALTSIGPSDSGSNSCHQDSLLLSRKSGLVGGGGGSFRVIPPHAWATGTQEAEEHPGSAP